jgi:hypothetical protein
MSVGMHTCRFLAAGASTQPSRQGVTQVAASSAGHSPMPSPAQPLQAGTHPATDANPTGCTLSKCAHRLHRQRRSGEQLFLGGASLGCHQTQVSDLIILSLNNFFLAPCCLGQRLRRRTAGGSSSR